MWLDSPVTCNTCLFPGWRRYLLPLARLATERIKRFPRLPSCSKRCSSLPSPDCPSREELPAQTTLGLSAQQVSSGDAVVMERGRDHESPLALRVRAEGNDQTGSSSRGNFGHCCCLQSRVRAHRAVPRFSLTGRNKFFHFSSINKILGPLNVWSRACKLGGQNLVLRVRPQGKMNPLPFLPHLLQLSPRYLHAQWGTGQPSCRQ